jgi:prepilin-type processing-associated H-X9-DG protein
MSKRDYSRKFSPIEVLVVVFVCLFALAVLVPATQMSQFEAFRIQCSDNLSQIGRAMIVYANDYDDEFPRSGGRNSVWAPTIPGWNAFNRYMAYGISADGSGGSANISSCFYLLVKYAEMMPGFFVCPGDAGTTAFQLSDVGVGFGGLISLWDFGPEPSRHCSYAYQMPFGFYAPSMSDDPGLALAADRNPLMDSPAAEAKIYPGIYNPDAGREAVKYGNAIAHDEEGQNVLFLDGHVAFEDHSFCGIHDDNIYTYWNGGDIRMGGAPVLGSQPQHIMDSVLVHDPVSPSSTTITKEPQTVDSADLEQTSIIATLDSPLPKYRNVIWCSTFQMAWDKLKNDVIGEPVEDPGAEKLAGSLNAAEFSDKDLEEESYFATAGLAADGIVEQIRSEMAQRFPSEPAPVFDDMNGLPPETIIAYSFLNANIEFEYPFYVNNLEFDFQDSNGTVSEVTSFCSISDTGGTDSVREQVDVLYYEQDEQTGETEFAVDLCKYTNPYQVVLACVPQQKNLGKTVAYAEQKISEYMQDPNYEELRKLKPAVIVGRTGGTQPAETLIVPDVLYKLTHHFAELEGKPIGNQPWLDQGYYIQKAVQMTDFTLARTGVELKSDAQIIVPPLGLPELRRFDFNRPFLIYIKKREPAASPFFVMWVDNAELMQEFVFVGQ